MKLFVPRTTLLPSLPIAIDVGASGGGIIEPFTKLKYVVVEPFETRSMFEMASIVRLPLEQVVLHGH
jgi:hypothetical protein